MTLNPTDIKAYTFGFGHGTHTPYDYAWALQAQQEHWDKYAEMATKHGVVYGEHPATVDHVRGALTEGDWALNTIPLVWWDRASAWLVGKPNLKGHPMSISEAVCIFKHVAKVAAGCTRPVQA
jgi:hypothetical protein